jgi:hypothetical protein
MEVDQRRLARRRYIFGQFANSRVEVFPKVVRVPSGTTQSVASPHRLAPPALTSGDGGSCEWSALVFSIERDPHFLSADLPMACTGFDGSMTELSSVISDAVPNFDAGRIILEIPISQKTQSIFASSLVGELGLPSEPKHGAKRNCPSDARMLLLFFAPKTRISVSFRGHPRIASWTRRPGSLGLDTRIGTHL